MARRKRRNHTADFKAEVALAAVKGDKANAELARQFDVHPNLVQEWKKRLVEGAKEVFGGNSAQPLHPHHEVEKLHAKIGQLTMENDLLSRELDRYR